MQEALPLHHEELPALALSAQGGVTRCRFSMMTCA